MFPLLQTFYLTDDEFWSDIKDPYIEKLAKMEPEEVYPSNNPGGFFKKKYVYLIEEKAFVRFSLILDFFLHIIFLYSGSTLPDGSINFECHCVGHLVASPCGYEFR